MKRWITALACLVTLAGRAPAQLRMQQTARIELENARIIINATDFSGVALAAQTASGTSVGVILVWRAKAFTDSMRLIAAARPVRAAGTAAILSTSVGNISVRRTVRDTSDEVSVSIDGSQSSTSNARIAASPSLLVELANAIDSAARRTLELTGPERVASAEKELAHVDSVRAGTAASAGVEQPPPLPEPPAYFEFQVEKAAAAMPDNPAPVYPDLLRAEKTEGAVLAQFVIDTAGVPELGTLKILRSSHALFTQAVRDVLPRLRFTPAETGGRKVRQLQQMPFTFQLNR